jgi:di/tricarboxylate transporter
MTPDMILVLLILSAAVVLLVGGWIPMEVTALMTLGAVALTGLISPDQALSGFSNPAGVTGWAVFILSGGLTRTGVANLIGRYVLRWAGTTEARIIAVVMISAGVMSAFMNNIAVAALMLPVVMDVAHRTQCPPSRLLMPLAYGSLLGGLTTMIGTPPNILVSNALRDADLRAFQLFDYTPVGLVLLAAGVAYMVLIGRRLLPKRDVEKESAAAGHLNLQEQYDLQERMFLMRVPADSALVAKTLLESRLGAALGLHVVGILRNQHTELAPSPLVKIQAGDRLLIEGRLERINELSGWRLLTMVEPESATARLLSETLAAAEARVSPGSLLAGKSLREAEFQNKYPVSILSLRRNGEPSAADLHAVLLQPGDRLLFHGAREQLTALEKSGDFEEFRFLDEPELSERSGTRLLMLRVPEVSILLGKTLKEARLGEALGIGVLLIERQDGTRLAPFADLTLMAGDRVVAKGKPADLLIVQGLEQLEIQREVGRLESESIGMMETVLSPRTTLAGKTLRDLHFREKYGLSVLAVWRGGRPYRTNLGDMPLRLGDALLLYGPRERLRVLGREPDFIVLTEAVQEAPLLEKANLAMLIMAAVLLPVILGVAPIAIAVVVGAALMVMARCLTMAEAYRAIEWRVVFLIAGMLPLGIALDKTGTAQYIAEGVVATAGPLGPLAVMAGLLALTFLATCVIPIAAVVVLMAPIILSASAGMGVSPHMMMMGLAMAASSSFMSPISHPANLLVMGPGGYQFKDYIKVGLPLTLLVWFLTLLIVPLLWGS